ncbi:YceH family protein [Urbifossiella limnaea]|uniref:Uncharacterized protein n=1 Tax=Urbifossiella limnaea TaxID=2528023 RepID=A0A517XXE7_9BACT|nr:DUF480 domain-containing protein [Urbifossiella limnaea]QDU22199.1 hypothetical protein ETAA1_41750 [Urbifossiella limnaea]
MSTDPNPPWQPLPEYERRVLGVLVEKQKTAKTADAYPLTLNSLTTGCNQKSNRDPVLDLLEDEVEEVLSSLQKKGLVNRLTGGRVDKFRHLLYDVWTSNGPQLAVLAELLLRGPQTKGELRGRASRMAAIETLDDLEEVLKPLAERKLVVYLGPPDRRGALVTHGFHGPDEAAGLSARQAHAPAETEPPRASARVEAGGLEAEITALKRLVAELTTRVAALENRGSGSPAGLNPPQ